MKAQKQMKMQADRQCTDKAFEEGDQLYPKLRPYRQLST